MQKKPKSKYGYSKSELIEIINEIDADKHQMRIRTEKLNTHKESIRSHLVVKLNNN